MWRLLLMLIALMGSRVGNAQEVRKLIFNADNDQRYMTSKVYTLKYAKAVDVTPWVLGAVKRNCPQAKVERVNYKSDKTYLLVSMSVDMVSFVDDMIKKLDRPGRMDDFGSIIEGTDVTFFSYTPQYRSSRNMIDLIYPTLKSDNAAFYISDQTNQFYWKDNAADGKNGIIWLSFLDRPVPQVSLKMNVYELSDSDLVDLGIDYLHWKNGPGLEMLGFGADILSLSSNEELVQRGLEILTSSHYAWGGFFFAPNFDASFVRMLQQRGKAKIATSGSITMVNHSPDDMPDDVSSPVKPQTYTLSFTPDLQSIRKNEENMTAAVVGDDEELPVFTLNVTNPTIFFDSDSNFKGTSNEDADYWKAFHPPARIVFRYLVEARNLVQKDMYGTGMVDSYRMTSSMTVEAGEERLIGAFVSDYDVEQSIGMPFLKDLPVLKYLFGTSTRSRQKRRFIVTVDIAPMPIDSALSRWAGKLVREVDGAIRSLDEMDKE